MPSMLPFVAFPKSLPQNPWTRGDAGEVKFVQMWTFLLENKRMDQFNRHSILQP